MKHIISYKIGPVPIALLCAALVAMPAAPRAEFVVKPKVLSAYIDLGQFGEGKNNENDKSLAGEPLTRTGAYVTVGGVYDERLEIKVTTGGLFWYPSPEQPDAAYRIVRFGPGVGQAQAVYSFGENPANPTAKLQFGLFPVKYSNSHNLGEYLFRSGTYPGYLQTGGWSFLNSSSYLAQGARLSVPMLGGKLTHDLTMFMERGVEPIHNFSPGYMVSFKPTPMFEIGAGGVWAHGLAWKPSKLSPKEEVNAYSKSAGLPVHNEATFTPCGEAYKLARGDSAILEGNVIRPGAPAPNMADCAHYTFNGVKLMGRAAANLGSLIGHPKVKPDDFKIYAEIALLGVKDYPFYYEKKMERMPVMAGINLPTFGLLDRLSAEVEYKKSRFRNTFGLTYLETVPVPLDNRNVNPYNEYAVTPEYTKDDWKWSFYAKREITKGVNVYAQAASDHLRHTDYEAKIHARPTTLDYDEWYYIVRLEFGLF